MFVQRLIWRVFQADENIFVDSFTEKVCAVQAFIAGCVCRADKDNTKFKQIIRHIQIVNFLPIGCILAINSGWAPRLSNIGNRMGSSATVVYLIFVERPL